MPAVDFGPGLEHSASFVTNTNWQSYSGESTMGYLVQMAGLAVQNFASAAVGIAVAVALVRGLPARSTDRLGNFWVDLTRGHLRVAPAARRSWSALVLVPVASSRTSHGDTTITTLAGGTQTLTGGPVASQEAIKELGTNGGGFYNANSAHPFENPTALHEPLEIFLLLVIPFCCRARSAGWWGTAPGVRDRSRRWPHLGDSASLLTTAAELPRTRHRPRSAAVPHGGQGDPLRRSASALFAPRPR